jgi:hypothetical protein
VHDRIIIFSTRNNTFFINLFMQLSFSPATPFFTHAKVLSLLTGIHITCLGLLGVCLAIGYFYAGINTVAFLAAEV